MKPLHWIIACFWLIAITGVEITHRTSFYPLIGLFTIGFTSYVWLVYSKESITLTFGLLLAIVGRLAGFFTYPLLSDDFYRYIWDGMVMHMDINPMSFTPSYLMSHPNLGIADPHLYALLNSKDYYAVYPPIPQWINYFSFGINKLNLPGHVLFYKSLLVCVDIIIFFLLKKLLTRNDLPVNRVLIYALNPLIIIEYTGNLHFESLMILFLLAAILFSDKGNMVRSGMFMAASIASKLLTFILIPFMPFSLQWKKLFTWSLMTVGFTLLAFALTFRGETGWVESCRLWFQSFEFNASIYYLIREIGFWVTGYNPIQWIGPSMGIITIFLLGALWILHYRKKTVSWSHSIVYALTIYFLMSTTVHSWYIGTILALSVLSLHTYPSIWTYLIFLSYSHYADGRFEENYYLITTEYAILFAWIIVEFRIKKKALAGST